MCTDKNPRPEIELTPEMIAAGGEILYRDEDFDRATANHYAAKIIKAALKAASETH